MNFELFSDKTYSDLLLDLKILSKLKKYQKLCIINNKLSIDVSYLQSITRYINNYSRENEINYLELLDKKLTEEIESIIKKFNEDKKVLYIAEDNTKILINLNNTLNLSLSGINNLIQTYINDEVIKSRIEILIDSIELKNRKISELLIIKNQFN